MMTPAHFFGGYLVLQAGKKYWLKEELTKSVVVGLLVFGLILAIAIDLDVLISGGLTGHHQQLTHYPFFWLTLSGIMYSVGQYFRRPFLKSLAVVTLLSSWSHMLLDLVGVTMGIHWFWPFSMKEFSVTPIQLEFSTERARWDYIMNSPIMWVGDTIVMLAGVIKMVYDGYKGSWFKAKL